jgi:phosphate-selective porin OprO and OprP
LISFQGSTLRLAGGLAAFGTLAALARAQQDPKQDSKPDSTATPQTLEQRVKALEDKQKDLKPNDMSAYWGLTASNKGLKFESADKYYKFYVGGRIEFDTMTNFTDNGLEDTRVYASNGVVPAAPIGPQSSDMEIRRARLNLEGSIGGHVEWKEVIEFVNTTSTDKELFIGFYDLGDWIPNVRAGQQYEPFGQDQGVSDVDLTFLDFAAMSNAFCPFTNPGFQFRKDLKDDAKNTRLTWAAGIFRPDGNVGTDSGIGSKGVGGYAYTGRVTARPWYDDGDFLHVGLSVRYAGVAGHNQNILFQTTPEAHLYPTVISTGTFIADSDTKIDGEAAFVKGPFSVQGEYIIDRVHTGSGSTLSDPTFSGYYGQVAYTLTGERRGWKPLDALFVNPTPSHDAFKNGGMGAWEIATRYSSVNLNDGAPGSGVAGGRMDIISLGLNWYANQNTKVMWDVARADVHTGDPALGDGGATILVQMRVQIAF